MEHLKPLFYGLLMRFHCLLGQASPVWVKIPLPVSASSNFLFKSSNEG